ncbi:MAG: CHASE2 domain-containing protein [Planctomycetes bacterium]|nr:CHASE2 domain-containing protein [Planctomycetota bacterium]
MVILTYALGGLDWLELRTLDLRFRYANSATERDDLVRIDVDDGSLELVGRWPWPRDRQSALIAVAAEAGAKAILVDLTFVEGESVRTETARHLDIVGDPLELTPENAELVYPDYELRAAAAAAGSVYLAFHYAVFDVERGEEFQDLLGALALGDQARADDLSERITANSRAAAKSAKTWEDPQPLARARVVEAIARQRTRTAEGLVDELKLPASFVEEVFEPCRQFVLREYIRTWLEAEPLRWREPAPVLIRQLHGQLTKKPFEHDTPFKEAVILALREVLGYEATVRSAFTLSPAVGQRMESITAITPVYYFHARAARRCGFVVFEPDIDGITRRMPLLVRHHEHYLPQLAFGLACDLLGVKGEEISVTGNKLVLRPRRGPHETLTIQIDERGRALVPWLPPRRFEAARQPAVSRHVPAAKLWEVAYRRHQIAQNERVIRDVLERLLSSAYFPDSEAYQDLVIEAKDLRDAYRLACYRRDSEAIRVLRPRVEAAQKAIDARENAALAQVEREYQRLSQLPAQEMSLEDELALDNVQLIHDELERAQLDHYRAANVRLQAEIERTLLRLRERLAGRICLIGYTATSLADMTPIPTLERAPGVYAHYDLLNGLLSGRLVTWASPARNALGAAILGMLVTLVSTWRRPRQAMLVTLALIVVYVGLAGGLAFQRWTYWIALTPAVGTMLASYAAITIYRHMFVEKERRQLTTALGQYTSSTLARQMAEDAELCKRAESREVTAVFTDLRAFTTISERIGAERTQNVLNICLGRFSEVMLGHEAMINKFIGDGIFAFWNPVIYPQPDHARRACETSIDLLAALRALIEEQLRTGGDEIFAELVLRIGVATGNAVVGPCGSEQKYDYTCIGDSVNVAARLEPANKFYGTHVLVSGPTRDAVDERFDFRWLGGVQVKGKRQTVPVYELLGRHGDVAEQVREYARDFGAAVALFQQRRWEEAQAAFKQCSLRSPDDLAARQYADAVAQYLITPPGDEWAGALELTEK